MRPDAAFLVKTVAASYERPVQNADLEEGPKFNVIYLLVRVSVCLRTDFIMAFITHYNVVDGDVSHASHFHFTFFSL